MLTGAVWLCTAAAAYGGWLVAEATNAQGGMLVPLGVFFAGLSTTWRLATRHQKLLNRLARLEEEFRRLPCSRVQGTLHCEREAADPAGEKEQS